MNRSGNVPLSSPFQQAVPTFWNQLDPSQQQEFVARSILHTFLSGQTLMYEGEAGRHVIVISSGLAQVFTGRGVQQQVIAERGPGELIGELAALHIGRSATVVALGTVEGLVMQTQDFMAFLDGYPYLLDVIKQQIYGRFDGGRPADEPYPIRGAGEHSLPTLNPRPPGLARAGTAVAESLVPAVTFHGENCTVAQTDIVSFSDPLRSNEDRLIMRESLREMTQLALIKLNGICHCEDRGDGMVVVAPASVPTIDVLRAFHEVLPAALKRHNRKFGPSARMQLRLACDVGPVVSDAMGVQGETIIRTARMLEAHALKKAIAREQANLGIVVSPFVYDIAIDEPGGPIDSDGFAKIQVNVKRTHLQAWMKVFDPAPPLAPACLADPASWVATAPPRVQ